MFFKLLKKGKVNQYTDKIQELLECTDTAAAKIDRLIADFVPGKVNDIVREDDNVGKVMFVYNSAGDKYIFDINRGNIVESIYKNDRDGERVYFIMY